MDDIIDLRIAWQKFQYKIEEYEKKKEGILRQKFPGLDDESIYQCVSRSSNRHFRKEVHTLLNAHLAISAPNMVHTPQKFI